MPALRTLLAIACTCTLGRTSHGFHQFDSIVDKLDEHVNFRPLWRKHRRWLDKQINRWSNKEELEQVQRALAASEAAHRKCMDESGKDARYQERLIARMESDLHTMQSRLDAERKRNAQLKAEMKAEIVESRQRAELAQGLLEAQHGIGWESFLLTMVVVLSSYLIMTRGSDAPKSARGGGEHKVEWSMQLVEDEEDDETEQADVEVPGMCSKDSDFKADVETDVENSEEEVESYSRSAFGTDWSSRPSGQDEDFRVKSDSQIEPKDLLCVGMLVRVTAKGISGVIQKMNGHAFVVAGKWYLAEELQQQEQLCVGMHVRVTAKGITGFIKKTNGHAFSVAGKWYLAEELQQEDEVNGEHAKMEEQSAKQEQEASEQEEEDEEQPEEEQETDEEDEDDESEEEEAERDEGCDSDHQAEPPLHQVIRREMNVEQDSDEDWEKVSQEGQE